MHEEELLTAKQAAAYIHSSENSLRWMRSKGVGPRFTKPDGWHARYSRADLDAYIAERVARTQKGKPRNGHDTVSGL
jgi:hypothetical protein